ncbi:MAG TPA: tRNA preQ1(34) S-adenosylmethionine ribosyltransferase-isomerase QueA, partial [Gemmatimonadetes bacterium]|nr:tRNA preQ1(34) S-adenosylmethionine ribosyltransferase-isomerase QueA [Gemmatimonadota bacterium]
MVRRTGSLVSDYEYELPPERIARYPAERRDGSRLLVVPVDRAPFQHRHFPHVVDLFAAGDVLVVNESKVLPVRLLGTKPSGARAEVFL